jgi:cytochrome bd ubiquinol oxidase subunit I
LDVVLLSRLQFAMTVSFHYIFPPLSIGLGMMLVFFEGMYLKTGNKQWENITRFWTKVFAVNFAMGVATGIVMEFQFGTNWATYSRFVGDIFGSALAAEGIFAFFLESGFLAVLVFGWDRVSSRMHFFATCMVALGSIFSSVWIVVANSWQHTPAGYILEKDVNGFERAVVNDFWAMVFNDSAMHRLGHVILGAFILGAFFVMSVCAYYILKGRHLEFAKRTFKVGLIFGAASSAAIGLSGHKQAEMVAHTQPIKLAAFEGHYKTSTGGTPLYLMGLPDDKTGEVKYGVAIPGGLSFLVHMDFNKPLPAMDTVPPELRPKAFIPFLTYHVMAGLGAGFVGLTMLGLFFLWRGTLFEKRWLMWIFVVAVVGPYIANQAGWVASETGRQPWVVTGLLKTTDAVSKSVPGEHVLASIVIFFLIYLMLFAVWVYVLNDKIKHGPEHLADEMVPTDRAGFFNTAGKLGAGEASMTMTDRKAPAPSGPIAPLPEFPKPAREDTPARIPPEE